MQKCRGALRLTRLTLLSLSPPSLSFHHCGYTLGALVYDIYTTTWPSSVKDCGASTGSTGVNAISYFGHKNVCWDVGGKGYDNYPDFSPAGCYPSVAAAEAAIDPMDPMGPIPAGPKPPAPGPGPGPAPTQPPALKPLGPSSQSKGKGSSQRALDPAQLVIWSIIGGITVCAIFAVLLVVVPVVLVKRARVWITERRNARQDHANGAGGGDLDRRDANGEFSF
jgi:hypothetical protein